MNENLRTIPTRIVDMALCALTQANTHSCFSDPHLLHWDQMTVLNAALLKE